MALIEFTWVLVIAIIFAFISAFGIGANDVANAFATSVGAKSITIKQAIVIAAIFEFSGAFLMGSHVTDTIRKGITDAALFEEAPELLMFGMMCVCVTTAFWLLLATYWKLPVSTTHTCVGAVLGFTIACKGWGGVNWEVFGLIVLSWFVSPILSGIFAVGLYKSILWAILNRENPVQRTIYFYPVLTSATSFVVVFYTIYKGSPGLGLSDTPLSTALAISFGIAAFIAGCTFFFVVPWLKEESVRMLEEKDTEMKEKNIDTDSKPASPGAGAEATTNDEVAKDVREKEQTTSGYMDVFIVDVEKQFEAEASPELLEMCDKTIAFDESSERMFTYLQVISACFDAFAHGANDVANSIGPLAAVAAIYASGEAEASSPVPLWVLGLGGVGIVVGLALYGYKIIQAIGFELTKLSPSRGFSIEIGSACIVIIGSRLGIPLSTTHCQVGGTVGVGLTEGCGNVNCQLIAKVVGGWLITCVIAAIVSGLIFSFAVYAPCN